MYVPIVDELRFSVELPEPPDDRVMLDALSDAVRLPEDDDAVIVMVPVNPPRLVKLRVELPVVPTSMFTVDGLEVRPKSGTLTVTTTL